MEILKMTLRDKEVKQGYGQAVKLHNKQTVQEQIISNSKKMRPK